MDENNNFERFPGSVSGEREVPAAEDFSAAMNGDGAEVPEFAGEQFGVANDRNEYYGEGNDVEEQSETYNEGVADAAALINYGLNAAARSMGVELVVQKIKSFDASGMKDPIQGLFEYLGVNTPEERKGVREENIAAKPEEAEFRDGANAPSHEKSVAGAFAAIEDMKELIAEVEGADPRYAELREGAREAGKGYFDFAVSNYGVRGLTELFTVLGQQREKVEKEEEAERAVGTEEDEAAGENIVRAGSGGDDIQGRETLNPEILKK